MYFVAYPHVAQLRKPIPNLIDVALAWANPKTFFDKAAPVTLIGERAGSARGCAM